MSLFLSVSAILLLVLGVWGGPIGGAARKRGTEKPAQPANSREAWDILARPMADPRPVIQVPEHRPWYVPSGDRRFQRGILVGLGAGLVVAALSVSVAPNDRAHEGPGSAAPAPATGVKAPAPGITVPAPGTTEPAPAAAKPAPAASTTFTVEEGDMPHMVAARLKSVGLIADEQVFLQRLAERGLDSVLKAGTFTIPTGSGLDEVIDALTA